MKDSDSINANILLIGDIETAFTNADVVKSLDCSVCADILDGIEAAAREKFSGICVVMSAGSSVPAAALKALREANSAAKIILLAEMHREPAAIQLAAINSNGTSLADDYLICPVHFSHLAACIGHLTANAREGSADALTKAVSLRPGFRQAADTQIPARISELEKLATEDALTGLKNRRYILEFCRQIIEHAGRENGQVTLLVFDIDNFKHYNDLYGHPAGDDILKQVAVLMRRCCREHDIIGRIGGDEFVVIFWDLPRRQEAIGQTERRSAAADHPKEVLSIAKRFTGELNRAELSLLGPEGKGTLTISGGLASFPEDGHTTNILFNEADKVLLEAKRSGKNRIYLVGKNSSNITGSND